MDLNVLVLSKEKFSLLVGNTNVVSGPVIASALIKKKNDFVMLKGKITPKSLFFLSSPIKSLY